MSDDNTQPTNGSAAATTELNCYQRGAAIRNRGLPSPIVGLPEPERQALLHDVLMRALNGERQVDIARDIGVHQTALSQALLRYCEDEWREVQVARAWTAVDEADEAFADVQQTPDMPAIIRAEKRLKSAQWQLERLHRRLFGQDVATSSGSSVVINIGALRQDVGRAESDAQPIDIEGSVTG